MMWFIPKNKKAILSLAAGLPLFLGCFMAGCKESAPPAQPAVVKKRIEQPPETSTVAEVGKTVSVDEGAEMPAVLEKTTPPSEAEVMTAEALTPDAETVHPRPSETVEEKTTTAPPSEVEAPETAAVSAAPADTGTESLISSLLDDSVPKYDPTGKVDPFAALFSDESETESLEEGEPKRPLTPLEKIDISQLKLVAILLAESGNRAMVEDATGKPYILTPGIYIGINSGVVKNIQKDRVVIEEKTKDFRGRESASTRELKLQKPFGEE